MNGPRRPSVSVVVPIHDKDDATLIAVLGSLLDQGQDETIVVLDRTPQRAADLVVGFTAGDRLGRVTVIRLDGGAGWSSFGRAANAGLRAADGDLVYFLQSDVVQAPGNIERARQALSEMDCVLFGRVVEKDPERARKDPLTLPVICSSEITRPLSFLMALPRWYGERLGWYDEVFMAGHGLEDLDLAWRLWDGGMHFVFWDAVDAVHQTHDRGFWDRRRHQVNEDLFVKKWGKGKLERHWAPGHRQILATPGMRVWINPRHAWRNAA